MSQPTNVAHAAGRGCLPGAIAGAIAGVARGALVNQVHPGFDVWTDIVANVVGFTPIGAFAGACLGATYATVRDVILVWKDWRRG